MTILAYGIVRGSFGDRSGIVWETFGSRSGSFGSRIVRESFGDVRGSFEGRSEVIRESTFGVVRGSFGGHSGVVWGLFEKFSKSFPNNFSKKVLKHFSKNTNYYMCKLKKNAVTVKMAVEEKTSGGSGGRQPPG